MNEELTLKQAVEEYRKEKHSISNSYEWYRKYAQKYGNASIGSMSVKTYKRNGVWYVDKADFNLAIKHHRESVNQLKKTTQDYRNGIISGKDGDTIKTEFGSYTIHGDFRFEVDDYLSAKRKSNGTWYCNKCGIPAETEHNKEECHLCFDWNGCGEDCTLSKVFCSKCGVSLNI